MESLIFYKLVIINALLFTTSLTSDVPVEKEAKDFCQMEVFKPECRYNEIIVMTTAKFGRMKIGRCVLAEEAALLAQDETTFGCFSDVQTIMDKRCSGKSSCEIRIPDNDLESTKPCYPGLKMYLEANYECVTVITRDTRSSSCTFVASSSLQHLRVGKGQFCGVPSKPWVIEASLGKTIQLSMLDFHASNSKRNSTTSLLVPTTCPNMGHITDRKTKKQETICNTNTRVRTLFNSVGNVVEVAFQDHDSISNEFFLRFKATGCSDIIPAEDSWVKRDGHSLVVGCYSSRRSWTLTCRGDKWIGVVGNCSRQIGEDGIFDISDTNPDDNSGKLTMSSDHQILIIIAIVGFGLVICLATVCVGVMCVRKCYSSKSLPEAIVQSGVGYPNGGAYYNDNTGMQYSLKTASKPRQYINASDNNGHYEESKYFVLDQEALNDQKT